MTNDIECNEGYWSLDCDDCKTPVAVCEGWGADVNERYCLDCARKRGIIK